MNMVISIAISILIYLSDFNRRPQLVASTSVMSMSKVSTGGMALVTNAPASTILERTPKSELEITLTKKVRELEFENQRLIALLTAHGIDPNTIMPSINSEKMFITQPALS